MGGMFDGVDEDEDAPKAPRVRPMLAEKLQPEDLQPADFPIWMSPKVDGYRCLIHEGRAKSRKFEMIPNAHVQRMLGHAMLNGLDGEICVGPPNAKDVFNKTQSGVTSYDGEPDFVLWVFDLWNVPDNATFEERLNLMQQFLENDQVYSTHPNIRVLPQVLVHNVDELNRVLSLWLDEGYEGGCGRRPAGQYKSGRSTANLVGATNIKNGKPLQEWVMLKFKKFTDGEAVVLACEELEHNDNALEEDNLGNAKRSSSKDGMRPGGCLGKFLVRDCETGKEFRIGTGFDQQERELYWNNREAMIGLTVKYKYFEPGMKDLPRHPVFLGFRNPADMGEPA